MGRREEAGQQGSAEPGQLVAVTTPLFPSMLELIPIARRPTKLPVDTVKRVLARPIPDYRQSFRSGVEITPVASLVIVTIDNLAFNRLCLESVLGNTASPCYEVILVDNGSTDGTRDYLGELAQQNAHVRLLCNPSNRGFAAATNQGLAVARGDILLLLNNDTLVPPGWLAGLTAHLRDPGIGLVGPVTNRAPNKAQISVPYQTYGGFVQFAEGYTAAHQGELFDIGMLTMFCVAMRREAYERIG